MSDAPRWISVGEMASAFGPDNNTPRSTAELAGHTLTFYLENGQVVEHRFLSESELVWTMLEGKGTGRQAGERYVAYKVRDGIYFVDFVRHLEQAVTVSLVLDLRLAIVTALITRLPGRAEAGRPLSDRAARREELTSVRAAFLSGAINERFTTYALRHEPTTDLVDRRVEYSYSATERYEHIYLNERFYTWHCLLGAEKGLADTDRCHCRKVANDLYFFVWRRKIVPALGAVMVNFDIMRTVGKILGYQGSDFDKLANFPVGAHIRLLNVTRHDDGQPREPEPLGL